MIIKTLEEKLRSQERHLARQEQALSSATVNEEKLLAQIDQMGKDKRSKSWHILKEIQGELRQDHATIDADLRRRNGTASCSTGQSQRESFASPPAVVATPPRTFPHTVPNTADSYFSAGIDLNHTQTPASQVQSVNGDDDDGDLDLSAANMTVPTPQPTPAPAPPSAPTSAVAATPAAQVTNASMYDSFEFTPLSTAVDTPLRANNSGVYSSERMMNSMSKSEIFAPPVDISWDQNDSFNARFTGTDKGIHHHQSAHVQYDVRRSSDSHRNQPFNGHSQAPGSSDVSLGSREPSYAHLPNAKQVHLHSQDDGFNRRVAAALSHRTTAAQANPVRRAVEERHAEEVQAIYSDIGRLSGRLESRLQKSSSPEEVNRVPQGGYNHVRAAQHK